MWVGLNNLSWAARSWGFVRSLSSPPSLVSALSDLECPILKNARIGQTATAKITVSVPPR